ncbi:MAG: hypothetical protein F6K28_29430 [Microcoleus sp. SIO2G3]|nr:hypothetical protein [Microcoleus sp. SIO2G3]
MLINLDINNSSDESYSILNLQLSPFSAFRDRSSEHLRHKPLTVKTLVSLNKQGQGTTCRYAKLL